MYVAQYQLQPSYFKNTIRFRGRETFVSRGCSPSSAAPEPTRLPHSHDGPGSLGLCGSPESPSNERGSSRERPWPGRLLPLGKSLCENKAYCIFWTAAVCALQTSVKRYRLALILNKQVQNTSPTHPPTHPGLEGSWGRSGGVVVGTRCVQNRDSSNSYLLWGRSHCVKWAEASCSNSSICHFSDRA
jgi:hypothetical protein